MAEDAPDGSSCETCARLVAQENLATVEVEIPETWQTAPPTGAAAPHTEVIGDYEILGKLGQGGMGAVYRARQISLDRVVALKILPSNLEEDENYVARFQREAAVAAGMNHLNLVHVYTSGVADGVHFIAMELVEGENLRQRLKRGEVPMAEALRISLEVARGLQFAWQRAQLIHRDIKPSNIYLSEAGEVKVGDLGLAKSLVSQTSAGLTHTGVAIGTPHYISPEQARGDKSIDLRADIYSLGCTLYELLTGATPYKGSDPLTVMSMHLNSPPPAIMKVMPQCPTPVGRVVNKMLRKGRHERHQNYEELIAALEGAQQQLAQGPAGPSAVVAAWKQIGAAEQQGLVAREKSAPAKKATASALSPAGKWKSGLWIALAATFAFAVAGIWWFTRPPRDNHKSARVTIATPAPPIQNTTASNAPSAVSSATVEPWQDLLANAAVKENLARKPGGALLRGYCHLPISFANGALRTRFVVQSGKTTLWLWARSASDKACQCMLAAPKEVWISRRDGNTYPNLARVTLPAPLEAGSVAELEFRLTGPTAQVRVNGALVAEAVYDDLTQSACAISTEGPPIELRSLEYLNLDVPAEDSTASQSFAATKDAPFTNSLGMKFVPVPITGGPTGGQRVLVSIWETRVQDYDAFLSETNRERIAEAEWKKGKLPKPAPTCPASWINREDAREFCSWLTKRERKAGRLEEGLAYRLPSDFEWSCAAGIGRQQDPSKPWHVQNKSAGPAWGNAWPPPPGAGNFAGEETAGIDQFKARIAGYRDPFPFTAPVGSFQASELGLYDLIGNVAEWCEDIDDRSGDGIIRGGHFATSSAREVDPADRFHPTAQRRGWESGCRVVLAPAQAAQAPTPAAATKNAPFTNSLGMRFVPVPITGGPTDQQRVLFSVWETRVQDYLVYSKETKRPAGRPSWNYAPLQPITCTTWDGAVAFCEWLTERERKLGLIGPTQSYRLPTDHEWSCAAGIGAQEDAAQSPKQKNGKIAGVYVWGATWPPPPRSGNFAGEEVREEVESRKYPSLTNFIAGYSDEFTRVAPVGQFPANPFGLFDLAGNVSEYCSNPGDDSEQRICRGGSWEMSGKVSHSSSYRGEFNRSYPADAIGFRVVLAPAAP